MDKPGFKVIHQADIDTNSTCLTFVLCLQAVKTWSDAHPGHVPIDDRRRDEGRRRSTPATFDALEAEIRSVFPPDDLITPDDVRGDDASLGARGAHARLADARRGARPGHVHARQRGLPRRRARRATRRCAAASCSRRRRPGDDDAAVAKLNDPIGDAAKIKAALAANMLVRTRADADTVQARANDTTMRDSRARRRRAVREHRLRGARPALRPVRREDPGGTPAGATR